MSINASLDQAALLEKINQYSETNRRTDRLSACMRQFGKHWDTSHTAFIGLQLRALNWVTTFKDSSPYARWDITPLGKAALLEIRNAKQAGKLLAPTKEPDKKEQYAVFCEDDSGWQQCDSREAAEKLARKWLQDTDEGTVHVVQIVKTLKLKRVVEEV